MRPDKSVAKKAYAFLTLQRHIVGVKFLYEQDDYLAIKGVEPRVPIAYCQAVKAATAGNSVKLVDKTSGCAGSSRALGFVKPAADYYTGESGMKLGLYAEQEVARSVANDLSICTRPLYGLAIKPLEDFEVEPDVVLLVTNTREAMRVLQGYTYVYGMHKAFPMTGNQAVCVECTTYPFLQQSINLSMFCSGTRHKAGWKDSELAIGMPYKQFVGVVQGLQGTVNAIERNGRKAEIERTLRADNLLDMEVTYGKTYFLADDTSPRE